MRKLKTLFIITLQLALPLQLPAQVQELQQLALNVEKLAQFRAILRDMKAGYEILREGYTAVKDVTEDNFSLHETFLDGLLQVSPQVRNYKRTGEIIGYQRQLMESFSKARERFITAGLYTAAELGYFDRVYAGILAGSLQHLDELTMVLTSGQARMSDSERLATIDRIYSRMQDKVLFMKDFTNEAALLGLQRARESADIRSSRLLRGINP